MTDERWALSVSNRPANSSLPVSLFWVAESDRNSVIIFSASSSGVRRAARRCTSALTVALSFHLLAASSRVGPFQTAASEISGTLAWAQGQSGYRGSAAKLRSTDPATANSTPDAANKFISSLPQSHGGSGRTTDRTLTQRL